MTEIINDPIAAIDVAVRIVKQHRAEGLLAEVKADIAKVVAQLDHQRKKIDFENAVLAALEQSLPILNDQLTDAQRALTQGV